MTMLHVHYEHKMNNFWKFLKASHLICEIKYYFFMTKFPSNGLTHDSCLAIIINPSVFMLVLSLIFKLKINYFILNEN
jgi:hypothetical protein